MSNSSSAVSEQVETNHKDRALSKNPDDAKATPRLVVDRINLPHIGCSSLEFISSLVSDWWASRAFLTSDENQEELEAEILSATSFGEAFGEMLMDMKSELDDEPMHCGSITKEDKYNSTDCPQTCGTFFECRMETLKFEYEMQQEQQHLYHQRMNELNN